MNYSENKSSPKGPIAWMVSHSVAANLIMLACLFGGYLSLSNIKKEVFPEMALDEVRVTVPYPGASPEEVEQGILLVIEEAVSNLDGVDEVTSVANEGSGTVTVEALVGTNMQKLAQDVQNEVDRIITFPDEAEEPQVSIALHKHEVLTVYLSGDVPPIVLHQLAEQVRDRLLQDPDITQLDVAGLPPLEIAVEISQENLRRYKLTLEEVATRLRNASVELPGGGIKTGAGEILLRVNERRDYGRQFAKLPIITTSDGTEVLLEQIAVIKDGFEETDRYATYNGKQAVMLEVYRVGDQTPIQVADAVKKQLEMLKPVLPPSVEMHIDHDRSDIYRQRIDLLLRNAALGTILVFAVLGLFLEFRLAFWVMMGIPVSFLGSFLFLPATGVTINMISLFAYIIALGIVVDDAIVVGENIYQHHQEGMPFMQAAVRGTREVFVPVTFSILTNIATFIPLYFVPGRIGKIFKMIPVVVVVVFLISLFESIFVLPSHLAHQRDRRRRGAAAWFHQKQQAFSRAFIRWVKGTYGPFLDLTLRHRGVTIALAVSLLILALSYAKSGRMGFETFPKIESDYSIASVVLPYGSPVGKTDAIVRRLADAARKVSVDCGHPEILKSIAGDIGNGGSHMGNVRAILAEPDIRNKIMSTEEFSRRWREEMGEVAGIEYLKFESDRGGPGSGAALTVELSHRNIEVLDNAGVELADILRAYPQAKDVDDGFQPGKQQLSFRVNAAGKSLGLTANEVARQVRNAFYGARALRQQRGRNEIQIMVRLPETERISEYNIEELMIHTPQGTYVPIRGVVSVSRGRAYTQINRRNGRRVIQVNADVTPRNKTEEILEDLQSDILPKLTARHSGLTFSFEGRQADIRESMGSLKTTFTLALFAVFALLAIPFRSYLQPLIVMTSIPFGIIGAFLGHLIMGYSLSIMSMFGIVALAGVVVNDSLVMVDFANLVKKERGLSYHAAIVESAISRFRPIMLTTLTTFGGLMPMIFETSRQAKFLIPMALSLGFGLLFATLITLVLIPSLYVVIGDIRNFSPQWSFLPQRNFESFSHGDREGN